MLKYTSPLPATPHFSRHWPKIYWSGVALLATAKRSNSAIPASETQSQKPTFVRPATKGRYWVIVLKNSVSLSSGRNVGNDIAVVNPCTNDYA